MRTKPDIRIAVLALFLLAGPIAAQETDEVTGEPETETETVDEIVVVSRKRGDPVDLDARYEEQLRKRLIEDFRTQRLLEERARWRRELESGEEDASRIRWGYDPAAELRMRQESGMTELPLERTKPATLFRIEF